MQPAEIPPTETISYYTIDYDYKNHTDIGIYFNVRTGFHTQGYALNWTTGEPAPAIAYNPTLIDKNCCRANLQQFFSASVINIDLTALWMNRE